MKKAVIGTVDNSAQADAVVQQIEITRGID